MKTLFKSNLLHTACLLLATSAWADDDCDLGHTITKVGQTHWLFEQQIGPTPPPFFGNSCEFSLRLFGDEDATTEPPHHAYYNEVHKIVGSYFSYRFSLKLTTMLEYMEDNNELLIFQVKSSNEFEVPARRPLLSLSLTNHPGPSASSEPRKQWKLKVKWGHGTHGSTDELILKEAFAQQVDIFYRWRKMGYNNAKATLSVGNNHFDRHVPSRTKTVTTRLGYIRANKDLRMGNQIEFGVVRSTAH